MTWTDGYISDVAYPAFFYKEMQPGWLSAVAGFRGYAAPDVSAPFSLCELGCGVGVNLLVAAACHPDAHFVGVDFDAEHLSLAREAAAACGADNVEFIHADFATFARTNSQQFDFITSHGVWSWIAENYRTALLNCVAGSLNAGGLFHLHYMCHPGSTDLVPLQHLLNLSAHHLPGPSPRKAQIGLKLLQQIADSGMFADKPAMLRHLANLSRRDPADLAHEFLADHWEPQHSADVHQLVSRSGLTFLGSADVFNNLDVSLSVPGRMQALIRRTTAPALAETLKDLARDAHQRTDLFQKDPRPLDHEGFLARLGRLQFRLLPDAPQNGPLTFATPIGPLTGPEGIFTPLLQRLAAGPASGAELSALPPFRDDLGALVQALQLLMMQQLAHPMAQIGPAATDRAERLSRWFARSGIALSVVPECATAVPCAVVPT